MDFDCGKKAKELRGVERFGYRVERWASGLNLIGARWQSGGKKRQLGIIAFYG
jgi:hypothetical protein